jgi:hypothetical protein
MNAEFDRDDALARRMHGLQSWQPVRSGTRAWERVLRRRQRSRTRHTLAGSGAALLAIATFAVIVNFPLSSAPRRLDVVGPAARDWLPVAPTGAFAVTPAGPYRAGQSVTVTITPTSAFRPDDPLNTELDFCYRWSRGENCDPTVRSKYVDTDARGVVTYRMRLPGWVFTPTGQRACSEVRCRVEFENLGGKKAGSKPLDIRSGAQPKPPARITSVGTDARIGLHLDAIRPDPSWSRWAATAGPNARKVLPPGHIAICAFTDRFECDGLVRVPPPRFDGRAHDVVVRTNRLLLTRRGWTDCAKVQCALSISRSTQVTTAGGGVSADGETLALLPYRLAPDSPVMPRPRLTIAPHPPVHVGDRLTVTLHDPPPFVNPGRRLTLAQCASDDLRVVWDCRRKAPGGPNAPQPWEELADGSLQQRFEVIPCWKPSGCYLAIEPPLKGHPGVARTPRFAISP